MNPIENILEQRRKQNGDYVNHAIAKERITLELAKLPEWGNATPVHRQGAIMVIDKLCRAFNGDFNFLDHWLDIQGYAKLVENYCSEVNNLKNVPDKSLPTPELQQAYEGSVCNNWELRGSMAEGYEHCCWNCKHRDCFANKCSLTYDKTPLTKLAKTMRNFVDTVSQKYDVNPYSLIFYIKKDLPNIRTLETTHFNPELRSDLEELISRYVMEQQPDKHYTIDVHVWLRNLINKTFNQDRYVIKHPDGSYYAGLIDGEHVWVYAIKDAETFCDDEYQNQMSDLDISDLTAEKL